MNAKLSDMCTRGSSLVSIVRTLSRDRQVPSNEWGFVITSFVATFWWAREAFAEQFRYAESLGKAYEQNALELAGMRSHFV